MGSFAGHAVPGFFLCLIGFWWILNMCLRFYETRQKCTQFRSSLCYPSPGVFLKKWPVDAILVIGICSLALAGQLFALYTTKTDVDVTRAEYYEHAVLFAIFILMTLLELLRFFKFPLPAGFEYLSGLVAFLLFALVLLLHARGQSPMHYHVHLLLSLTVVALSAALGFEMAFRHSFLAAIFRGYFTVLSGAWIIQIGLFLYPLNNKEPWTGDDKSQIVLASMIYSWYCAGIFGLISFVVVGLGICSGKPRTNTSSSITTDSTSIENHSLVNGNV